MRRSVAHLLGMTLAVAASTVLTSEGMVPAEAAAELDVAAALNSVVDEPRSFGYVVGDVLTQRVLLQLNGRKFQPASLPRAERISAWLERRASRIDTTPDGRRWLAVSYQLINAPQALTMIKIPAWELKASAGTDSLRIGEWPISIAPLTPRAAFGKGDLEDLRPDHPAPLVETGPLRRRIAVWSGAFVASLAIWTGWLLWRNWRAAVTQPFASALREIRGIDETGPEAWKALHRAFDRTAGRVTLTATLSTLFEQAPHLVPLRSTIEQFFKQSGERFFGAGLPRDALSVRELCTRLRRIEKAHER